MKRALEIVICGVIAAVLLSACSKMKAEFTVSDTDVDVGEKVTFTSTSTGVEKYIWDFGDGKTSWDKKPRWGYDAGEGKAMGEMSPTHVYKAADSYTVKLTVISPRGEMDETTAVVNVGGGFKNQPQTFTVGDVSFKMMPVQGGNFLMGNGEPTESHRVTLSSYYIGQTEVTQALWQAVMGFSIQDLRDSIFPYNSLCGEGATYPMYYVSWNDICESYNTNYWRVDFLSELNTKLSSQLKGWKFVLPTEAQWEYAAAGGQAGYDSDGMQLHKYSGSDDIYDVAWFSGNSGFTHTTHNVGEKAPNELDIYDMSGNVQEWCSDAYDYDFYYNRAEINPNHSWGDSKVVRGGHWRSSELRCRVDQRNEMNVDSRTTEIGFRLALIYKHR